MEISYTPRRKPRRTKGFQTGVMIVLLFLVASCFTGYFLWSKYQPNDLHVKPDFHGLSQPIFYQGELQDLSAIGKDAGLKLPFKTIKALVDPTIVYEEETGFVVITTKDKVVHLKTDLLTGKINDRPFTLKFPVELVGDEIYLPADPLKDLYSIHLEQDQDTRIVTMTKGGDVLQLGAAIQNSKHPNATVALRAEPTIHAPILHDLKGKEPVRIWQEANGWYKVQTANGVAGYAQKGDIILNGTELVEPQPEEKAYVPWKPLGGKLNLTWEHVVKKNPDTAQMDAMPGLNVASPTWFSLKDGQGNISNLADPAYVKWAHDRGYQVWALFSNSFEPDITREALSAHETRMNIIRQLVSFVQVYHLQGVNIDFENVYLKDKDKLTQFVRELTPLLHEQGAVVSMDVTIRGGSEMWSLFYDREALGKVVDYMMVMTYDEHWATSPAAGSVASLPWVEKGITEIMQKDHVPASKLVLGVPYYTRIWKEEGTEGEKKVTSQAAYMSKVKTIIAEKKLKPVFDEQTGQHYVEYKEGKATMKIWIEDAISMQARAALVKKYDLAGIASWRRGFETPEIWDVIKKTLEQRP